MKFRTMLMMALTIFCGAGAGIFLTISDESLFGTYLYTFFPFAVALLCLAIGYELIHELRSKKVEEESETPPAPQREKTSYTDHHPRAA